MICCKALDNAETTIEFSSRVCILISIKLYAAQSGKIQQKNMSPFNSIYAANLCFDYWQIIYNISEMFNKSTSSTNSKEYDSKDHLLLPTPQKIIFPGSIKRENGLFSRWKDRHFKILHAPNHEVMMTISHNSSNKIEEIINLSFSRLTTRCSARDRYTFFGLIVPSGKKYLIAAADEQQTRDLLATISKVRKEAKQFIEGSNEYYVDQKLSKDYGGELHIQEFEKKSNGEDNRQNLQFQKEGEQSDNESEQIFSTVLKIQEEEQISAPPLQAPLILQSPLSAQQSHYLQSDQGFKLHCNFNEGRLLSKGQAIIKANLLLTTHCSHKDLLEAFFHLQLWNQKIKDFKLVNRIEEGIYMVYLQLKPNGLFSSLKYTYLMVTTWTIGNSVLMIMKSLDPSHFEKQNGIPIGFNLFVKVKDNVSSQKLMTVVAEVGSPQYYEQGLNFMKELKIYQSFLKTTFKLPHRMLEWRQGSDLNCLS